MFNVNYFIVSQANPYVLPLMGEHACGAAVVGRGGNTPAAGVEPAWARCAESPSHNPAVVGWAHATCAKGLTWPADLAAPRMPSPARLLLAKAKPRPPGRSLLQPSSGWCHAAWAT